MIAFDRESRFKVTARELVMIAFHFSHLAHVRQCVSPHYSSDF